MALLTALVDVEGPRLWDGLRGELASVSRACNEVGVIMRTTDIFGDAEEGIRIRVSAIGARRVSRKGMHVRVVYAPKERSIKCYSGPTMPPCR